LWRKPGPAGAWPAITLKGDIEQHRAHQVLLIGQLHVVLKDVEHLPGELCFGLCRCFVWGVLAGGGATGQVEGVQADQPMTKGMLEGVWHGGISAGTKPCSIRCLVPGNSREWRFGR
jgi:hypothetical protein